jgi:signal transduction histidine kinase
MRSMRRAVFSSLRFRLISLVLLAVIPTLGLLFYTTARQRQLILEDVQTDLLRLVRLAAVDHTQLIDSAHQLLVTLSQLPEVHASTQAACQSLMSELLTRYPFYTNLGMADPSGNVVCHALQGHGAAASVDRDVVRRVLQDRDLVFGRYRFDREPRKATVTIAYPVLAATGEVHAVVFVEIDLEWFHVLAAEANLPPGTALTVLDDSGTIFARYPESARWVGRSAADAPIVKTILGRGAGVVQSTDVDGAEGLFAFTRLEYARAPAAFVSVGIPTAVVFARANEIFAQGLLWLGFVSALALAAAWMGGNVFILRRVRALVDATKRLAAGDLGARTGLRYGGGEIDHFARTFDEMAAVLQKRALQTKRAAESLRKARDELEMRVEKRTADLRTANKRLEELSKLKDEFVSNVSHELRSPLLAVKGGVDLMLGEVLGPVNEEQRDFLTTVEDNIRRLSEIVNDLLDISKIEAGKLTLVRRRVNLPRLIDTALKSYRTLAGQRAFQTQLVPVPDVFADPNRILQILGNLVSNAVKFTQDDGTITINFQQQDGQVAVSVEDDGIGIAQGDLPKLFQKFSQVGASDARRRGTGLGLALCKQLVALHQGTIGVSSELGKGSTFTFTLPSYHPTMVLADSFQGLLASAKPTQQETVAVIALDANPFVEHLPVLEGQTPVERLEYLAECLRKQVRQDDEVVLSLEPAWLAILAILDARDVHALVRRVRMLVQDLTTAMGMTGATIPVNLGAAVHPTDGTDAQSLFVKATGSLNQGLAAETVAEGS